MSIAAKELSSPVIARLLDAINAHDLDALVDCFAEDVTSEQPAHPARSFRGRAQLRQNWTQIFGGVPDLRAELVGCHSSDGRVWTEWAWSGTARGGAPFELRGVTIQQVRDDRIAGVRFYMEPLERGGADVGGAIRQATGA